MAYQVYLDSADFSNASNPAYLDKHPDFAAAWASLIQMSKRRLVDCRFSVIHISEIAHLTPEAKQAAIGRARALRAACGNNALRFVLDLYLLDGLALLKRPDATGNQNINRDYALADNGEWLPLAILRIGDLRETVIDGLKNAIKALPLTSRQKREAREKLIRGRRLTKFGLDLVRNQPLPDLAGCGKTLAVRRFA